MTVDVAPTRSGPLAVWGTVGAGAVILVTAVLVFWLGHVPLPAFESADQAPVPARDGRIALLLDSQDGRCLELVQADDGQRTRLRCEPWDRPSWTPAWTTSGELVILEEAAPDQPRPAWVVDPGTGEQLRRVLVAPADPEGERGWPMGWADGPDGTHLTVDGMDGHVRVTAVAPDGARTELMDVTGPSDYRLQGTAWSPDGRWILTLDTRGRLLVLDLRQEVATQVLTTLGDETWLTGPPAWFQPGQTSGRVEVVE